MKENVFKFLVLVTLICACDKKVISNNPFEIDKDITCNELYDNGYKWSPGVDVILLGKKTSDTLVYYQVHQELNIKEEELFEEVEADTTSVDETEKYKVYLNQDPLVLSDSIYNLVWGDLKEQQNAFCEKSKVVWRNCIIKLEKEKVKRFSDKIESKRYKVLNLNKFNLNQEKSYAVLERFRVLNKIKRDTFDCSIYREENEYYFSSRISIK